MNIEDVSDRRMPSIYLSSMYFLLNTVKYNTDTTQYD